MSNSPVSCASTFVFEGNLIVGAQNTRSYFWVCATPPTAAHRGEGHQRQPLVICLPNTHAAPSRLWQLIPVNGTQQYYYIQNVDTKRFAWVVDSPTVGSAVLQSNEARLWKVTEDTHRRFIITPVGSQEEKLFWTGVIMPSDCMKLVENPNSQAASSSESEVPRPDLVARIAGVIRGKL